MASLNVDPGLGSCIIHVRVLMRRTGSWGDIAGSCWEATFSLYCKTIEALALNGCLFVNGREKKNVTKV